MLKKLFTLVLITGISLSGWAQVCVPIDTFTQAGLYPEAEELPCVVQGTVYDTVIIFENFEEVEFGGSIVPVNWVRIDSITNMPGGLSWKTNKSDNTFQGGEAGCIRVCGTTSDPAGQYKLGIYITADVGVVVDGEAEDLADLRYDVRVKANAGDACPDIDTTSNGLTASVLSTPFELSNCYGVGVEDLSADFRELTIAPNPFSNKTEIRFQSEVSGNFTATLFDVVGKAVRTTDLDINNGFNIFEVHAEGLNPGMYFYTITDGNRSMTVKLNVDR